jgi:hypothetical protein
MIDVVLKFLVAELNSFLTARTGSSQGGASLGRLVDDAGKCAIKEQSLGAALANVDEERVLKSHAPSAVYVNGRHVRTEPELRLNLTVVFAANFTQYDIALRQLSWVLTFFQAHPQFTRDLFPALDPRVERFTVELQSLTYEQLNQLWAAIGGKQIPSAVYRLRLVVLQDVEPVSAQPPVTDIAAAVHP